MNYTIKYRKGKLIEARDFSSVKNASQYVRRHGISNYKLFSYGIQIEYVGNTRFTLIELENLIAKMNREL